MPYFTPRRKCPKNFVYSPADRATNETANLMLVKKGDRILWGGIEKRVLSSTANTIALRVAVAGGGAAGGLKAALSASSGAVGDLIDCDGADLANAGGYLVTADSTIDAVYTAVGGGGTTVPQWGIWFAVSQHEHIN